jgi:hypothetical protein
MEETSVIEKPATLKKKVKKIPTVWPYKPAERFAVVRKLAANKRYYCNFRVLYQTKEEAEQEASRLKQTCHADFYVIEIQSIAK